MGVEVTFGIDRFMVDNQDELPILMRSVPGRLLQVHQNTRASWYLFFADKNGDIHCGFRKSSSSTFHFFSMPHVEGVSSFREHILKLSLASALKYRRKKKNAAKSGGPY